MLNQRYVEMLKQKDIIFEIFQYAREKAKEVGAENIYDFSLGNPSVPAPDVVNDKMVENIRTLDPLLLHGYSPSLGVPEAREAVANYLNEKFGTNYTMGNIYMTIGAADALGHAFRAVTVPGDEVITFAPCFSEYFAYVSGCGLNLRVVPADIDTFQIDFDVFEQMMNPKVTAVLVNSPNNPSGIVYSCATIARLAEIMERKAAEFGHPIYLISDEPYRDIVFSGKENPYIPSYYRDAISCYSFSKSMSLPGERIGYMAVNPDCTDGAKIIEICPQISRTMSLNGPPSLLQRTIVDVCSATADLSVYEKNKNILYNALIEYGYECVEPGGTFYMFPRALEADAYAFCEKAKELNLMLVPGDVFRCPGHVRIAYCVPTERIERALPVFKKLAELYGRG